MSRKPSILSILNEQSKPLPESKQQLEIRRISVKQILPNEHNFYDTSNIEDLKASVEMFGIIQPLLVKKIDIDQYKVIAGHRRLLSARQLYESGKTEFEYVPCIVEIDPGIIKEKIMLIHTNSTTRELSDGEKLEQLRQLKELFIELKKTHNLPGRIRDLLADTLQVSSSAIGRMETVDKNLLPEFKEELKAQNISMQTAVELSKLDEQEQQAALKQHQERGRKTKTKDVPVAIKQIELEMGQESGVEEHEDDSLGFEIAYMEALGTIINAANNKIKLYELEFKDKQDMRSKNKLDAYKKIKELLEIERGGE